MTDVFAQYRPQYETIIPPQPYKGFKHPLMDPLGPEYTKRMHEQIEKRRQEDKQKEEEKEKQRIEMLRSIEQKKKEIEEKLIEEVNTPPEKMNVDCGVISSGSVNDHQKSPEILELNINPQHAEPTNVVAVPVSEPTNIVAIPVSDPNNIVPSSEDSHEIDLSSKSTSSRVKSTANIVVVLDRDEELPLSDPKDAESIKPSEIVLSPEQKQQVDSIMSSIVQSEEKSVQLPPDPQPVKKPKVTLKVQELRDLCKQHKLDTHGNKDALIRRLQKNKIL